METEPPKLCLQIITENDRAKKNWICFLYPGNNSDTGLLREVQRH